MSNDIFYTNISNLVTFYMGERPSADKFNAVNKYFSRGIRELATAIGDINDDGFPYIGSGEGLGPSWNVYEASDGGKKNRPLDIVSLGRLIGPSSNLNSRMHLSYGQQSELIQEEIESGSSTFELLYPVENNQITIPGVAKIDEEVGFDGSQQYKVIRNRQLLFSSATTEPKTVSYFTNPNNYYGGVDYQNSSFNVIPDPNQNEGVGITSLGDRKYRVTFPKITAQQSGLSSLKSSNISTENEFNNNKYYELPKWLIDSIVDTDGVIIDENKTIPGNFLYLKNRVTQEIYKDASYEYESPTSLLVSNLDICEDENGSYSNTDYCIILTGTNITNSLDDVRLKWFKHSHDGTFGESPIQLSSLVGKFKGVAPSGTYGPSSNEWNQMPMYLHRDGYVEDGNSNNGNNAMRGDLMLGDTAFDPIENVFSLRDGISIIENESGQSQKIIFSRSDAFMRLYNNQIQIINDISPDNSFGVGVYIQSLGDSYRTSSESIVDIAKNIEMRATNLLKMFASSVIIDANSTEIKSYKRWYNVNQEPSLAVWNFLSIIYGFDAGVARFPDTSALKELNDSCAESSLLSLAKVNFSFKESWVNDFDTEWAGLESAYISGSFQRSGTYNSGGVAWDGFYIEPPGTTDEVNLVPASYTDFLENECAETDGTKIEKLIIETFYSSQGSGNRGRWLFDLSHKDLNCFYDISFGDHERISQFNFQVERAHCVHPLYNVNLNSPSWTAKHVGIVINRFKNYYSLNSNVAEEIKSTFYIKIDLGLYGKISGSDGTGPTVDYQSDQKIKISFNYNGILDNNGEYVSILTNDGNLSSTNDNSLSSWALRQSSSQEYKHDVGASNFDGKKAFIIADYVHTKINSNESAIGNQFVDISNNQDISGWSTGESLQGSIVYTAKPPRYVDELYLKVEERYFNKNVFLTVTPYGPYELTGAVHQIIDVNNSAFTNELD